MADAHRILPSGRVLGSVGYHLMLASMLVLAGRFRPRPDARAPPKAPVASHAHASVLSIHRSSIAARPPWHLCRRFRTNCACFAFGAFARYVFPPFRTFACFCFVSAFAFSITCLFTMSQDFPSDGTGLSPVPSASSDSSDSSSNRHGSPLPGQQPNMVAPMFGC